MSTDLMNVIASLLAQAESTDNEHERETFMRAAQAKATRAQIDLAEARRVVTDRTKREEPVRESIWFDSQFTSGVQRPVLVNYVELFSQIASANDVKLLVYSSAKGVVALGMPSDIALCKALFAYLLHQMVVECNHHLKYGQRDMVETRDSWGYRTGNVRKVDARTERKSFTEAFAGTVGRRLREARREAIVEAEAAEQIDSSRFDGGTSEPVETEGKELTRTALVLRDKKQEVDEFYRVQTKGTRGSFKGNSARGSYSSSGSAAGHSAGARASISAHTAIGA